MKLKKISSLCNKNKRYILYDKMDSTGKITQWLGDGNAAYPLDGLPLLNEDSLCKMFDISEKQRDNINFDHAEWRDIINVEDTDPDESEAKEMELGIVRNGRQLVPLMGRDGIVFIDGKYLSPLEDEIDMLVLFERKNARGQSYIAVKAGLLIRAVIMPVEAVNDDFINHLQDILRECKRELQCPRPQQESGGDEPQITWTEVDE